MVDLWGPGAFGAAGAAAVRPPYAPTNGGGDPETHYADCTSPSADDGTEWRAAGLNILLAQMRSVARKSGVAISNLDDHLLTAAVRSQGANWRVAGGTANALTVTLDPPLLAYTAGLPLRILTGAGDNTAAMTVNVDGLGAKAILRRGGGSISAGDVPAASLLELVYDGTAFRSTGFVKSDVLGDTSIVGRTLVFTSSGTFNIPAGVTSVEVQVWGGGGAGGASGDGSGGGVAGNTGGGGGGGGYGYKRITGLVPGATETVTVGAGGAAGTGASGGSGGTSSFGSHVTCLGGTGGARGTSSLGTSGVGGTVSGADIGVVGGNGGSSGTNTTGTPTQSEILNIFNKGGLAAGGLSTVQLGGTGAAGAGKGAGGSGASGGSFLPGGAGAPGLVIVRW